MTDTTCFWGKCSDRARCHKFGGCIARHQSQHLADFPSLKGLIDPTSRGDMEAGLLRQWYEKNRQGWWERRQDQGRRRMGCADEFMLAFKAECERILRLSDAEITEAILF